MGDGTASEASSSSTSTSKRPALGQFPSPIVIPPCSSTHKSTIIFLHGRGSNAKKFHGPLLSSPLGGRGTFRDALPHTRFVFPTAPLMRATKYRRSVIHQWYDGSGDWEPEVRGYMRQSVDYIHGMLRQEIRLLDGDSKRVVLAGLSQGCAMSLTGMLLWDGDALGAAVGLCGFMPMNAYLTGILDGEEHAGRGDDDDDDDGGIIFETERDGDTDDGDTTTTSREDEAISPFQRVVAELRAEVELPTTSQQSSLSFLSTPVFLGHGTADEKVEYHHGRQTAVFLEKMGLEVKFHTYRGLGHWYSQEMLGHIVTFLKEKLPLMDVLQDKNEN